MLAGYVSLKLLFKIVSGLEEIASQEISEKLNASNMKFSPYGHREWVGCETDENSYKNIKNLRSIIEAHVILYEADFNESFSIDRFADVSIEELPVHAPGARKISISAYSRSRKLDQRKIQGAFSKRIIEKLNAECDFKNYDTALKVILLKRTALALLDLMIRPGNLPKGFETHPTPVLPPIAYCMVRLANPLENEHLLDPMCGCGTIPCMAALEWKNIQVIGADISSDYISCAIKNAEKLGIENKIKFLAQDIAELADLGVKADIIASNPPYGMFIPTNKEIQKIYDELFDLARRILSNRGRMVLITPYSYPIEKIVSKGEFRIIQVHRIQRGELPRIIYIIKKSA